VASAASRLLLDLGHHSYHDFDRQALEQLLGALPQLASVCLVGAVDGTDAYEPLGEHRSGAAGCNPWGVLVLRVSAKQLQATIGGSVRWRRCT
jgi:hypothetical protein